MLAIGSTFRVPLLLTGFEPFRHFTVNPSWHAAAAARDLFAPAVAAELLPVDHLAARDGLLAALARHRPLAVLCMGLAAGDEFRLEQRARWPEQFAAVDPRPFAPEELSGHFPWRAVAEGLQRTSAGSDAGAQPGTAPSAPGGAVPFRDSDDAGRFVCESTYFTLNRARGAPADVAPFPPPVYTGFLHVPAISPAFPQERITRAVLSVVEAVLPALTAPGGSR